MAGVAFTVNVCRIAFGSISHAWLTTNGQHTKKPLILPELGIYRTRGGKLPDNLLPLIMLIMWKHPLETPQSILTLLGMDIYSLR